MTDTTVTCARLDALLPDYLDGALGTIDRLEVERHLASCARCGALVADLDGIVAEARALPVLRPSRDLWAGVAERIATPVAEIGPRRSAHGSRPIRVRAWLAAAAVLLVVTTAGITYEVTRRRQGTAFVARVPDVARSAPDSPSTRDRVAHAAPTPGPVFDPDAARLETPASASARPEAARPRPAARRPGAGRRQPSAADRRTVLAEHPAAPIEGAYAAELASLARMVQERRGDLDPATIAVLEHSLTVIDQAIARSREALQRDPASGFLQEQLNHALDRKVGLLRTATRIPTRS